ENAVLRGQPHEPVGVELDDPDVVDFFEQVGAFLPLRLRGDRRGDWSRASDHDLSSLLRSPRLAHARNRRAQDDHARRRHFESPNHVRSPRGTIGNQVFGGPQYVTNDVGVSQTLISWSGRSPSLRQTQTEINSALGFAMISLMYA